jgi:hypothetical protein
MAEEIDVDGSVDPPAAPGSLTATGGTRRIQLTWLAVTNRRDILHYEVWRSNSAGSGPGAGATKIGTVAATTYHDQDSTTLVPNSTWYYWVRGIALAGSPVAGAYAGPASATTTLLIADDLADAIINTAKFASNIKPVLIIGSTGAAGVEGQIALNAADDKLYRYTSGAWTLLITFSGVGGQITTTQITDSAITTPKLGANVVEADKIAANAVVFGKVAAGAIRVNEIAAESLKASHLAADFALANSAQVGNLTVKNANIANLAVGTANIATQTVTQTAEDYTNVSTLPAVSWTDIADVTVTVGSNTKVLLFARIVTSVAVATGQGGEHGGGEGNEGDGGGSGV